MFQLSPLDPCKLEIKKFAKHSEPPRLEIGKLFALQVHLLNETGKKSSILATQNQANLNLFEKISSET